MRLRLERKPLRQHASPGKWRRQLELKPLRPNASPGKRRRGVQDLRCLTLRLPLHVSPGKRRRGILRAVMFGM
ncbi:hypothetical protein NDU88_006226 [Pleurodeles waltl]|uniref:Uncharacterized protein n=1 Tax=Pleurodeles waltl TaxID=8319 RepID=A0AAV7MDB1_PLEWA|nr:hypothetical protein NDU88_006226 [Pleurodeles waltl]